MKCINNSLAHRERVNILARVSIPHLLCSSVPYPKHGCHGFNFLVLDCKPVVFSDFSKCEITRGSLHRFLVTFQRVSEVGY